MRSTTLIVAVLVAALSSCGTDDSTGPSRGLEGVWNLLGYTNHGVSGITTGSATFGHDGAFVIEGTVTYPGEPTDTLDVSGTYRIEGGNVVLTTPTEAGSWSVSFLGDRAVLSLVGAVPPTTITLQKRR